MGRNRSRSWIGSTALLLLVAALLLRPWELGVGSEAPPRSARAFVTRAVDGDTIEVRVGGRREDVRYIGVDTPETVDPEAPVQCFGHRAAALNRRLVTRRRVRLVYGVERRDAYGRLLAYVYVSRALVNAELVRRGFARTLAIPPNTLHKALFERLQREAAWRGRGLWGACPP